MDRPAAEEIARRVAALEDIEVISERLRDHRAHLVGGAVRDLLLGRPRGDIDIAIEGDAIAAAHDLAAAAPEAETILHNRFRTAAVTVAGHRIDLATTRAETYARPGELPQTYPAGLEDDLGRRDFTVNAMAIPLADPGRLIDPHDGLADLSARSLRVLHDGSFEDDPTRALRAARYSARLDFAPEPATLSLLRRADLTTVSAERVEAELRLIANEADAERALSLATEWGLASGDPHGGVAALEQLQRPGWEGLGDPAAVLLAAGAVAAGTFGTGPSPRVEALLRVAPERPSACVKAARGSTGADLAIACSRGASWIDLYVREWRHVRLEVSGRDLIAAGVAPGPAMGRALEATLAAKLDGEVSGLAAELDMALAVVDAEPAL